MKLFSKYIVNFPGAKFGMFKNKELILFIDLPLLSVSESWLSNNQVENLEKLKAFFSYITLERPKIFHIVLVDTLQKLTVSDTEISTLNKIKEKNLSFIKFLRKLTDIYLANMGIEYEIFIWQDVINTKNYNNYLHIVNKRYLENIDFKNAIDSTAMQFVKNNCLNKNHIENETQKITNNINYIKKEIAVLLKSKYDFVIYSYKPTVAITKAYEIFSDYYKKMPQCKYFKIDINSHQMITNQINVCYQYPTKACDNIKGILYGNIEEIFSPNEQNDSNNSDVYETITSNLVPIHSNKGKIVALLNTSIEKIHDETTEKIIYTLDVLPGYRVH